MRTLGQPNFPISLLSRVSLPGSVRALLLLAGLFVSAAMPSHAQERQAADMPNVVLLLADDLGYGDLGCYGQREILTPNIDRLAAEGIRFKQAYAGSSVCAPSRCSLMTGMHNGHNRVRDNVPHFDEYLRDEDVTLAEVLAEVGYRCGAIGKWSLGGAGSAGRATNQGFESFLGYLDQDHAHYYFTDYLDHNEGVLRLPGNPRTHEHYSHDLLARESMRFVRTAADGPFFFYGAYTLPHFSHPSESTTRFAVPSDAPYTDRDWDQESKNYAAMITRLDRDVGRLVDLIDRLGLGPRTLILFASDNGPFGAAPKRFHSSGPLRGAKRDLYEGGVRVPLIARWTGTIPNGKVSDEVIALWDVLPTLAELAGATVPPGIDGHSAVDALLGGERTTPHDYLYWDYGHCRPKFAQAVRWKDYKAVRTSRDAPIELYDLSNDLGESHDIAPAHPEVVRRIEEIMASAREDDPRYPVGTVYRGTSTWVKEHTD